MRQLRGSGFKGSEVHGFIWFLKTILVAFYESSVGFVIHNLKQALSWQLCGKTSICRENFGPLILPLSLTLNVEP
jgi:hypothetical protein